MTPEIGDVWTTRLFRDETLALRVFKLASFMNLSIGVIDMEDTKNNRPGMPEKVIWFGKGDLQFFDRLVEGKAAYEKGSEEVGGSGKQNPTPGAGRLAGDNARVREIGNGQDRVRRELPETSPPAGHPRKGNRVDQ